MTTQKEMIEALSVRLDIKKSEAEKVLNTFLEIIEQSILTEGKVKIGTHLALEVVNRAARSGISPKTKEPYNTPAKKGIRARIYKSLKDLVK